MWHILGLIIISFVARLVYIFSIILTMTHQRYVKIIIPIASAMSCWLVGVIVGFITDQWWFIVQVFGGAGIIVAFIVFLLIVIADWCAKTPTQQNSET